MFSVVTVWEFKGGWEMSFDEDVELAASIGYRGMDLDLGVRDTMLEIYHSRGIDHLRDRFARHNVVPAGWQLTETWRGTDAEHRGLMERLPLLCKVSHGIGCPRIFTFLHSWSDSRDYRQNFDWHVSRLQPVAKLAREFGISLSLEWMGPPSLRVGKKHEFIHTMAQLMELIDAIGQDNVGILLDSWHWHISGGTLADLRGLPPGTVTYIHFCDAPAGVALADYQDWEREFAGDGVIDLDAFMTYLVEVDYDGPFMPGVPPATKSVQGLSVRAAATRCYQTAQRFFAKFDVDDTPPSP